MENLQPIQIAKMLHLGDLLWGKRALERMPRVWLNNLLPILWKDQKVQAFNHTDFPWKRLCMWSCIFSAISRDLKDRDESESICGGAICLMEWIPETYGRFTMFMRMLYCQVFWQLGLKGTEDRRNESCLTQVILHVRNKFKSYSAANMFCFSWKEWPRQ